MANKIKATPENPNGIVVALTADEEAQRVTDATVGEEQRTARNAAKAENDALKDSAKAKLIAGESLTEAEADTIVL